MSATLELERPMTLGRAVRRRREELGLSQKAAAEASGVSPRQWQRIEEGDVGALRGTTARAIERGLRWGPGSIEALQEEGVEPRELPRIDRNNAAHQMDLSGLSDDDKAYLEMIAATMRARHR